MEKHQVTFGSQVEYDARINPNCICGKAKEQSLLVCWDCFKREGFNGRPPLKWFDGSYEEWIAERGE